VEKVPCTGQREDKA